MDVHLKENLHLNSAINMFMHLDLTGTHHLSPDDLPVIRYMGIRPKFLIMVAEYGKKGLNTPFQKEIGIFLLF